jgi:hypothetical protein
MWIGRITNFPLVEEILPPMMARPTLIVPQWPLVVTRNMFQLPSNEAAFAGGVEQRIAKAAADRAKAHNR